MILSTLRERTRPMHERLEATVDLAAALRTAESYSRLLARFYGFYAPLEAHLAAVANGDSLGIDLTDRWKTPWLEQDLTDLGRPPEAVRSLPTCDRLPTLAGPAEAFGCLYVLEGATLGGQIVRRELSRRKLLADDRGVRFFSSYGPRVGEFWKTFGNALSVYAGRHPADRDAIVTAAAETFSSFEAWLAAAPPDDGSADPPREARDQREQLGRLERLGEVGLEPRE